jgi:hypothetical protein
MPTMILTIGRVTFCPFGFLGLGQAEKAIELGVLVAAHAAFNPAGAGDFLAVGCDGAIAK